ncbi:PH domain-containing protein [Rheinheimera pleomorphica]|uniref:PH domain-containing protein n=1 Tax=Rheinheimera pleomorphica TaxID=2703963 RepID=UPI00141E1F5F|nr:PH domain-containing protein [Rheinheimera pleomorphica]
MLITLQQPIVSPTSKLYQILLVNCILLGATFLGYKYLPSILALDPRPNVRLMVIVAMAPVLALCCSIVIGTKQPKTLTADDDGITLGDAIAGSEFYPWHDISGFSLNPNSKVLKFRVDSLQLKHTFRLKQFGITQQQFEQLQQLAAVGLKSE